MLDDHRQTDLSICPKDKLNVQLGALMQDTEVTLHSVSALR